MKAEKGDGHGAGPIFIKGAKLVDLVNKLDPENVDMQDLRELANTTAMQVNRARRAQYLNPVNNMFSVTN